jgi:hypothetical protein
LLMACSQSYRLVIVIVIVVIVIVVVIGYRL